MYRTVHQSEAVTKGRWRRSGGRTFCQPSGRVLVHIRTAAVAALAPLAFAPAAIADTTTPGTLSVSGQGSVMIKPDTANLSLSVTRFAKQAGPALSAANRRTDAIVAAV